MNCPNKLFYDLFLRATEARQLALRSDSGCSLVRRPTSLFRIYDSLFPSLGSGRVNLL
jgi:hypothetical protein